MPAAVPIESDLLTLWDSRGQLPTPAPRALGAALMCRRGEPPHRVDQDAVRCAPRDAAAASASSPGRPWADHHQAARHRVRCVGPGRHRRPGPSATASSERRCCEARLRQLLRRAAAEVLAQGPGWVATMAARTSELAARPLVSHSILGFGDQIFSTTKHRRSRRRVDTAAGREARPSGLLTARDFRGEELTKKDRQRLRAMVAAVRKGPCAPARGPERRGLARPAGHGGGPVAGRH